MDLIPKIFHALRRHLRRIALPWYRLLCRNGDPFIQNFIANWERLVR
jgi:hypothetical protein